MTDYLNHYSIFDYQGINHISDETPIFPSGEGLEVSLINLANYPYKTEFYEIETVGAIVTFLTTQKPKNNEENKRDENNFHIAIYVDDLIELYENGYVEGIIPISEFKFDLNQFNDMVKRGCKLNSEGNIEVYFEASPGELKKHIIVKPQIEKYVEDYLGEEWDENYRNNLIEEYESNNTPYIEFLGSVKISEKGYLKYLELTKDFVVPKKIESIIKPLLNIYYYDSAVREISVLFEHSIKEFHKSSLIGWKLIDFHVQKCIEANNGNNNAGIKVYRQELRIANSYIRNEFMHNMINVSKDNYYAILYRQCRLFNFIEQAFQKLSN